MIRTLFLFGCMAFIAYQPLWAKELSMAENMVLPDAALIFSPPKPVLSAQDEQALQLSVSAANAPRYAVQDADRTLHLYGSGRPTLICSPLKLCLVELQNGERVVENGIHLGDTVRWKVTPTVGEGKKTFLVIKPTGSGLESNLVIITDRHSYDVRLVSQPGARLSRLAWSYADEAQQAWQDYYAAQEQGHKPVVVAPEPVVTERSHKEAPPKQSDTEHRQQLSELDFNYQVSSCQACHWRPLRVYNNGVQTVIELPDLRGKEAPALLVLGQDEERMVNYRVLGNRYLVDQVFDRAALLLGVGERQQRIEIHRVTASTPTGRHKVALPAVTPSVSADKPIQYYVQLLNAIDQQAAKSHLRSLRAMGFRVELPSIYGQGQPALRVGPWHQRAAADAALKQLRQHYRQASLWEESHE